MSWLSPVTQQKVPLATSSATSPSTTTTTPYPTGPEIAQIFAPLSQPGQGATFFTHVADDVDWTILGHSPMSRHYASKAEFQANTLGVLNERVLTEPLAMRVVNVVGGGSEEQAVVEMVADRVCRNGEFFLSFLVGVVGGG